MAGALNPGGRIQDIAGECDVFLHDAYFPCHRLSCVQAGFERGHYAKPRFVFRRQAGDVALDGKKHRTQLALALLLPTFQETTTSSPTYWYTSPLLSMMGSVTSAINSLMNSKYSVR